MSVLEILKWPDPRLSTPCIPVGGIDEEVRLLAADMLETMYAAPGRGLAAPQVCVTKRLFVMDVAWKDGAPEPVVMVDPAITWRSDEIATGIEGCLSMPGIAAEVARNTEIEATWRGLDDRPQRHRFDGFAAICIQHEYDHLEGLVTFDRVSPEERQRLEAAYSAVLA